MSSSSTIQVKTVFLGDVSKSSILQQFISNQFDESIQATSGADFMVKSISQDGKKIDFQLWDTAGQERFRSLTQLYYKDARVACVVFDVSNRNSFTVLASWLKELEAKADKSIIKIIVGNKIDLVESQKTVMVDAAQSLAKSNDAVLLFTSAKDGTGVQELFAKIADQVIATEDSDRMKMRAKNKASRLSILKPEGKKKPKCC